MDIWKKKINNNEDIYMYNVLYKLCSRKPIHIHLAYTIKHIKNILDFFWVLIKLTQNFA